MRHAIEAVIAQAIEAAVRSGELALPQAPFPTQETAVERPRDPSHGDWASSVALRLAKELKRKPREIAEVIAAHVESGAQSGGSEGDVHDNHACVAHGDGAPAAGAPAGAPASPASTPASPFALIASVEVAGPGFINLRLTDAALHGVIRAAREHRERFARVDVGQGRRLNIEFISANPTGPMHVGHGRWAALGNAMCNVCEHAGWQVTREFYVNDAGNQMDVFGHSVALRYRELLGEPIVMPEASYGGSYVRDIAQRILDEEGDSWLSADEATRDAHFRERGYGLMLGHMQELCERIGVSFDVWFSERTLYEKPAEGEESPIETMLSALAKRGYLYEKDGATWFRSTSFSDDKDRVLIKADGSYTYFAPDIAYHLSKFERGSDLLVDIWGADHHGYIPRMKSACEALGYGGRFEVVLGQLVNLYRNGEAVRMSKRTGEMVTFEELVEEVGADATKYLMLSRSTDQPIDFDIELAKKQDASNPVYYVQYAHARICSLLRKGGLSCELLEKSAARPVTALDSANLSLLVHPAELELARVFARLAEVIEGAARDWAPFRLTRYAEELATAFHSFYTRCQVIGDDEALTCARLYLADATRSVLALVLRLLGVSAPEHM
ncbi:MAG: arginine--tRNA ligase [Coriobacteriales bacterium]|jgi:arginyl-tRNA synthetase|nr:arginine--tRNA ligase [Coriobacteriales bacterium]